MFAIIYQFKVLSGRERDFLIAWKELTQMIYQYEGSLGSRLHKASEEVYIAYAQWPSEERWKNSGKTLPAEAHVIRKSMRDSCSDIQTLYSMEVSEDLLRDHSSPGK